MFAKKLTVEGFRNIGSAEILLDPGINLIIGDNAQGKTNLLEALGYISLGKSFRGSTESEIIGFDRETASLSLDFTDSVREQNVSVRIFRDKRRRFEQNGVSIYKMSDIVGAFRAVVFSPGHLSLIQNGPSERRMYLDMALCQLRPVYMQSLTKLNKTLKQRNRLLKDAEGDRKTFFETVEFWSSSVAHESAVLAKMRKEYTEKVNEKVGMFFSEMTKGKESPSLVYSGSAKQEVGDYDDVAKTETAYFSLLTSNLEREIAAGATLYGAHKDDICIGLNGKPAREYASQGQQRSLSIAMKLAEGGICFDSCGEEPVFLLDDVLSELDSGRRKYLTGEMKNRQVIMTGCDFGEADGANTVTVRNGVYTRL